MKTFKCIQCNSDFERSRPDSNRERFCSIRCRWEHYVDRSDGCWEWKGAKSKAGYGVLRNGSKLNFAHRLSLQIKGEDISGKLVRHRCDNPGCVNPNHLVVGTDLDNVMDMMERKRNVWAIWSDDQKQEWLRKVLSSRNNLKPETKERWGIS